MGFRVIRPDELEWVEREPEGEGVSRHVARLSDVLGFAHTRGSVWRYPPGAKGRRHRDTIQEETFVVLSGTLTMYLGDPPERVDIPAMSSSVSIRSEARAPPMAAAPSLTVRLL